MSLSRGRSRGVGRFEVSDKHGSWRGTTQTCGFFASRQHACSKTKRRQAAGVVDPYALLLRMERIEVVAHIVAKGRANASDDDWRPSRARDAPRKFF